MKRSLRLHFALLTTCAALPVSGLRAQAPAAPAPQAAATPSVSAPAQAADAVETKGTHKYGRYRVLSREDKKELRKAHKAAMQDPAVKAAKATRASDKKGYRKTVRDAMLRADPNVGPILEQKREAKRNKKGL